jgi:hypothetical protein
MALGAGPEIHCERDVPSSSDSLIETQRQDAGKSKRLRWDVESVSVWPHPRCPFVRACSFHFPFNAVRLILRTPGLRTLDKQYIFPGPPQRQCCGILCSVAALYSALPIPALPRYYYYGDPPRPAKAAAVQLLQLFWLIFELSRFRGLTKGELRPQHRRNWGHFSNRKRSCNPS